MSPLSRFGINFIAFAQNSAPWAARLAIAIVYFWFGALKLFGLSPASPMAQALVDSTVGAALFDPLFLLLALWECLLGLLFLWPRATRVAIPLLFLHLAVVSAPLAIVPSLAWNGFLVPSLEGQYIIKNVLIVAAALCVAA